MTYPILEQQSRPLPTLAELYLSAWAHFPDAAMRLVETLGGRRRSVEEHVEAASVVWLRYMQQGVEPLARDQISSEDALRAVASVLRTAVRRIAIDKKRREKTRARRTPQTQEQKNAWVRGLHRPEGHRSAWLHNGRLPEAEVQLPADDQIAMPEMPGGVQFWDLERVLGPQKAMRARLLTCYLESDLEGLKKLLTVETDHDVEKALAARFGEVQRDSMRRALARAINEARNRLAEQDEQPGSHHRRRAA